MIKFNEDVLLTVITNLDEENQIVDDTQEKFKKGVNIDADIYEEYDKYVNIQFGDGSVAMNIERASFDIVI